MPEIVIRPVTAADLEAFYGHPPKHTVRGIVGLLDGQPIGIGGIAMGRVVFCELKPEARSYRVALVKGARRLLAAMKGRTLYAAAQPDVAGSAKFLEWLGFRHIGVGPAGELYEWQG